MNWELPNEDTGVVSWTGDLYFIKVQSSKKNHDLQKLTIAFYKMYCR